MIKLLFRLFRRRFLQLAFYNQAKPASDFFAKTELAFWDSNGKRYYRFLNDTDIPILRMGKLQRILLEYNLRMDTKDLNTFLDAMQEALDKIVNESQKGKLKNLAWIGHLVEEMRRRKEFIIEPDLLMELAAILYIREDENPAVIDDSLQMEKIEQFKKDVSGGPGSGLYDFFLMAGLPAYIPYLNTLSDNLEELMDTVRVQKQAQMSQITSFTEELSHTAEARNT
jgi:hypothetical protein